MKNLKKYAIIETGARLIKSDIKSEVSTLKNQYPSCEDLKLDSVFSSISTHLNSTGNIVRWERHKT